MRHIGNTICFATSYNRKGKHDGDEFVREMSKFEAFVKKKDLSYLINSVLLKQGNLRGQFAKELGEAHQLLRTVAYSSTFVFFTHGWWRGLIGVDHTIWTTYRMAELIAEYRQERGEDINIVLYACGCGGGIKKWKNIHEYHLGSRWDMRGEFGFAMRLANDLSELGVHDYRIFAHTGRGHVTKRPFCVWITDEPNKINTGRIIKRRTIVPYHSWASLNRRGRRQWLRWVKFIQETRDGRFQAPFLTEEELAEVIGD
jgi:hypothetical protein